MPIWRHSKYSLSLHYLYSKFGVFLAKVNGTGTKRIMNVIFFPPCYCSLHCFFFLFVWVYLKENLFCNDCLQFKSINPKFFQETDSGAGFTCKNWGAGFRQPHKCRCFLSLDPWTAYSVLRHASIVPHSFSGSALQVLGSRSVAASTWCDLLWWPLNLLCLLGVLESFWQLLSDQHGLNLGLAFVACVHCVFLHSFFPFKEGLCVFWVRLKWDVEVLQIFQISVLAC